MTREVERMMTTKVEDCRWLAVLDCSAEEEDARAAEGLREEVDVTNGREGELTTVSGVRVEMAEEEGTTEVIWDELTEALVVDAAPWVPDALMSNAM